MSQEKMLWQKIKSLQDATLGLRAEISSLKENTRKPDEWISVEDELPKTNGYYTIWDNGYGEGLFHEGGWDSTDRPIRNAMGVQCLRATIHPTHYAPIPTAPKEKENK